MEKKLVFDFEELLRIPYVNPDTGFDLSPDGKKVAFSWNRSGEWEIYLQELDRIGEAHRLTSGPGAKFGPRFSPDGKQLLYAVDLDGSESFDIHLINLASGEQQNLTPESPDAIQYNFCWAPDGKRIALISDRNGRFCTYILPLVGENQEPEKVYEGPGPNWDVHWSPDGGYLAVVSESRAQDRATAVIPVGENVKSGKPQLLALDGVVLNAGQVCWSPDGTRLAFSSDFHGVYEIGVFERESGEISWLTGGSGDKGEPDWSSDSRKLVYVQSEGPETWLVIHELDSLKSERYQIESGIHYRPRFTPDGKSVLCVFDSPRRPDDLWRLDLESKTFQQISHSLPARYRLEDFIMPKHVEYPSLDGRMVPALLYLPDGASKPGPAVIVIHGGPNWLFQYLWYPLMTHMVSRGWIVLAPNYRGSTGYGREWQYANRFEMGRSDTMDVAAGVDYLISQKLADPQKIAVTGRSHGGYLTMSCLTQYPDRWAGGSAVVPFLNWFTSHANSRQDLQHWDVENMGDPVENEALWRERSPYFYLDRVEAPVQLICGANDPRCPASESLAARDKLQALGKEVDFRLYLDEGHAFLKIENVIDHELRRVAFLAKALDDEIMSE